MNLIIPGPLPTVNHCYTTVAIAKGKLSRFKSKKYTQFIANVHSIIMEKFGGHGNTFPLLDVKDKTSSPINVEIVLYFVSPHIHDVDNYGKALFDSFNGLVWHDDCEVGTLKISKQKCILKKEERAEVHVELSP